MKLKVNGEDRVIGEQELSISQLLAESNVEMPDMVSVQLNGGFVKREAFGRTKIAEGDEVDFLYFMGGGSRQ